MQENVGENNLNKMSVKDGFDDWFSIGMESGKLIQLFFVEATLSNKLGVLTFSVLFYLYILLEVKWQTLLFLPVGFLQLYVLFLILLLLTSFPHEWIRLEV